MRPVAQIAQSVEQGIENPRVGGSIPSLGTKYRNPESQDSGFFYVCDLVDDVSQSSLVLSPPMENQVASGAAAYIRRITPFLSIACRDDGVLARGQLYVNQRAGLT